MARTPITISARKIGCGALSNFSNSAICRFNSCIIEDNPVIMTDKISKDKTQCFSLESLDVLTFSYFNATLNT